MTETARAQALYPDALSPNGYFVEVGDYVPIIRSFGTILHQEEDDDYSGDTFTLLYDKDRSQYGFLVFGWGSCSGCDALRACRSYADIDELIIQIENEIKWFDTLTEAKAYIVDKESRAFSFYSHSTAFAEFTEAVAVLVLP